MNYCNQEVYLVISKYANGNLCIRVEEEDGYFSEIITVNLSKENLTNERCAFIDTNRQINILTFLKKNKLGKLTGKYGTSGIISYPEFEFDIRALKKYQQD